MVEIFKCEWLVFSCSIDCSAFTQGLFKLTDLICTRQFLIDYYLRTFYQNHVLCLIMFNFIMCFSAQSVNTMMNILQWKHCLFVLTNALEGKNMEKMYSFVHLVCLFVLLWFSLHSISNLLSKKLISNWISFVQLISVYFYYEIKWVPKKPYKNWPFHIYFNLKCFEMMYCIVWCQDMQ